MLKKLMLSAVMLAALAGCSSVPMGDPAQDKAAKAFQAEPNKAGLYVYRNETIGGAVKMDVSLDGQPLGQTKAHTYLFKQIEPGKHKIVSAAENTDELEFEAKPGMLYYVWQEVKMGILYARNKLHLVESAEGQKGVIETQLAKTN